MRAWTENDIPDQTGKRVLVTGAASGIGFEAARALAERGAQVIIADRNAKGGEVALERIRARCSDAAVNFLPIDLSDLGAVKAFAHGLLAQGRPLDTLINNAGIQPISERRESVDGFELTFAIGHLGHFALTGLLLPLITAAPLSRIVTVSSMVHGAGWIDWDDPQMIQGYTAQRAYSQTKLANLLFARELARRLKQAGSPMRSMAVHPGVARTSIGDNRKTLGRFGWTDHLVTATLRVVMPYLGQSADEGALPTLYAASAPDVAGGDFFGPDGFGEMKGSPAPARIKPAAQDMAAAAHLWDLSEVLTGIRYLD